MRQVTAVRQIHGHNRVARIQRGEINRHIRRRTGVRLNIGVLGTKQRASAVDGELFGFVHHFATAVVTPARITFGVLVGQNAALSCKNG